MAENQSFKSWLEGEVLPRVQRENDEVFSLLRYANEETGGNDTTLGAAMIRLVQGYGQGGGDTTIYATAITVGTEAAAPLMGKTVVYNTPYCIPAFSWSRNSDIPESEQIDVVVNTHSSTIPVWNTSNSRNYCRNVTINNDTGAVLVNMAQTFRGNKHLIGIFGVALYFTATDRAFLACASLQTIRLVAHKTSASLSFSDSPNLTLDSLVSIANGLAGTATLTLHATSKTNCNGIVGRVEQRTDDTGTYDFFVQDDSGTMTLTNFITSVKGWTIA